MVGGMGARPVGGCKGGWAWLPLSGGDTQVLNEYLLPNNHAEHKRCTPTFCQLDL